MKVGTFVLTFTGLAAVVGALAIADHFSAPVSSSPRSPADALREPPPGSSSTSRPGASVTARTPGAPSVTSPVPDPARDASGMPAPPVSRGGPVEAPYTPATLHDRVALLARQIESGDTRGAAELANLLGECAGAPHRLGVWGGCGTRGTDCEPTAQVQRYREIAESCRNVPYDLIQRRQEFRDLATRGN